MRMTGVGGDSETRRWVVKLVTPSMEGRLLLCLHVTRSPPFAFHLLLYFCHRHPYIPLYLWISHFELVQAGLPEKTSPSSYHRDRSPRLPERPSPRHNPNAGRLAAMNRHYASPKGYGAYPRGASAFSIPPHRYVQAARASLPHESLEIVPTADLQSQEHTTDPGSYA